MKTRNLLMLCLYSMVIILVSCSKSDDSSSTPSPSPTPSTGLLTAKINGSAWAPSVDSATASLINGEINITGVARDGKTITITLLDTVVGTYDLGNSGMHAGVYQTNPSASSSYNSNFGPWDGTVNTLTIASIDKTNKKMTGTFTFKAYNFSINDSITISEGAFNNLPYVTSISGTGSNSFSVNINGTPYLPTNFRSSIKWRYKYYCQCKFRKSVSWYICTGDSNSRHLFISTFRNIQCSIQSEF